ncbi:MAG TPA: hypothetical protein PLP29_03615 [Candidatus Ozemobacteraceae bacterium]|nr:hypothetical protein [Candidatus Ozemobacteraceae bacterium]
MTITCAVFRQRLEPTEVGRRRPDGAVQPEPDAATLEHLATCPDCLGWLDREIATPPSGLRPAFWEALPTGVDVRMPTPTAPGSTLFHRLSLLLTGVAAAFALYLLTVRGIPQPARPIPTPAVETLSFLLPEEKPGAPFSFLEPAQEYSFVTRTETDDSHSWTFLDQDSSFSFIEDENDKEELWEDHSRG